MLGGSEVVEWVGGMLGGLKGCKVGWWELGLVGGMLVGLVGCCLD